MKKPALRIWVFTVTSNVLVILAILISGVQRFIDSLQGSNLNYLLGTIVVAGIWYLVWVWRINSREEFTRLSAFDLEEALSANADKGLALTFCPKCESDCYYASETGEHSRILICWHCRHTFSFVWCEKSGMGGDFVKHISSRPTTWACPDCHRTYALSSEIYDNPTQTTSADALPANVNISRLARQKKFELDQAGSSVLFLSGMVISWLLISPILTSMTVALSKLVGIDTARALVNPLTALLASLIIFVSTWYGLILYPTAIARKLKQAQYESL